MVEQDTMRMCGEEAEETAPEGGSWCMSVIDMRNAACHDHKSARVTKGIE